MNYEKMWNQLKVDLMKKVEHKDVNLAAYEAVMGMLTSMTSIETQEFLKSGFQKNQQYTVTQDITGNVDFKVPDIGKLARESFELITGYKVIDSLEKLESEIQKRRGRAPFSNSEHIVVDEKVKIPDHIWNEARMRGIVIATFGVDIMFPGKFPGGIAGAI